MEQFDKNIKGLFDKEEKNLPEGFWDNISDQIPTYPTKKERDTSSANATQNFTLRCAKRRRLISYVKPK